MNNFRWLFCQTLHATIPDCCQLPQRRLGVQILQHGWQNGLISWPDWSDADVAMAALLLDDLQNQQLNQELCDQHARRVRRRKKHLGGGELTAHVVCPWAGLRECVTGLQQAYPSHEAIIELVADATESYINLFGRLLGLWPYSDVRTGLRVSVPNQTTLSALHLIAVNEIVTAGRPLSADQLPGRILHHIYSELHSIAPLQTPPTWWNAISDDDQKLMDAVYAMTPNSRFVFASVIWGGLRIGQIAAFCREQGVRVDVDDVFYELQSAWQKVLPIL